MIKSLVIQLPTTTWSDENVVTTPTGSDRNTHRVDAVNWFARYSSDISYYYKLEVALEFYQWNERLFVGSLGILHLGLLPLHLQCGDSPLTRTLYPSCRCCMRMPSSSLQKKLQVLPAEAPVWETAQEKPWCWGGWRSSFSDFLSSSSSSEMNDQPWIREVVIL